jgi:excisionase family DNA binding protein
MATKSFRPKSRPKGALISISEVATTYGVHPRTIRRMIDRGQLTAYRIGTKALRLDPDQVRAQIKTERTPEDRWATNTAPPRPRRADRGLELEEAAEA